MEQWNLSPLRILRVLFWLRVVSIALQFGLALIAWQWTVSGVSPWALMWALLALSSFNLFVHWRLGKSWPVTEEEVTGHLLFDVLQFSVVLYFTGGAANPFVSLYLLPVALAAASLHLRFAGLVAAVCTLVYSLLLLWPRTVPSIAHHLSENFSLHLWGMWLNFILAAALLILFIGTLARLVRSHEREIAAARERTLRDEGILAVGTLAAGAAHQLGTPLSTMQVLLEDWTDQGCRDIQRDDVETLALQVKTCRGILDQLLQQVRDSRGEAGHRLSVYRFINDCTERWEVTRPEIKLSIHCKDDPLLLDHTEIRYDVTLAQALTNLLNNAADASLSNDEHEVLLNTWVEGGLLHCQIQDRGKGISAEQSLAAQRMFRSAKTGGMGIGLALSNSTIERLQGTVSFHHDRDGGITWVQIPLTALDARQDGRQREGNHAFVDSG